MEVHLYLHSGLDNKKLDRILELLTKEEGEIQRMTIKVDDVLANVQDETSVDQSIITLLNNISSQLAAAGTDAVKLQQVNDLITANKAAIAAAVVANTPAAPTV